MTEGENRESDTGSTPPPPERVWLPPRLRDRLEAANEPPPPTKFDPSGIIAFVVIAAMAGGVWFWVSGKRAAEKKVELARLEQARQAAVAESLAQVRAADSLKAVARADSAKAFLALPAWKQAELLSGNKGSGDPAAGGNLSETGKFTIDAGTFLFEDAAQDAANALKASLRQEVRVVPVEADGSTSYHIYIGNFTERGAAAYAADAILARGAVAMAKVVKLD